MTLSNDDGPWLKEFLLASSVVVGPLVIPTNQAPKAHQFSRATAPRLEGAAAKVSPKSSSAARESITTTTTDRTPFREIGGVSSVKPETARELPSRNYKAVNRATPPVQSVDSTSYCQSGTMADGHETYVGAVAGNIWPLGTDLLILSGEHAGQTVTVEDRIGHSSELDFYTPSCAAAWEYGREQILVEAVG